jgi:hypothetical protein
MRYAAYAVLKGGRTIPRRLKATTIVEAEEEARAWLPARKVLSPSTPDAVALILRWEDDQKVVWGTIAPDMAPGVYKPDRQ